MTLDNIRSRIAVLESKWSVDSKSLARNISINTLFYFLLNLHFNIYHEYDYSMIGTADYFKDKLGRITILTNINTIYIGAHGSNKAIYLTNVDINSTILTNVINITNKISGIYFGSCNFVTRENANKILNRCNLVS